MSKFIYIYKGPATPTDQFTPEQGEKETAAWGAWMGRIGSALAEVGAPFAGGTALVDDGSTAAAADLTGYSVVEAASLDEAKALAEGHPFLSEGKGRFSLQIFELGQM